MTLALRHFDAVLEAATQVIDVIYADRRQPNGITLAVFLATCSEQALDALAGLATANLRTRRPPIELDDDDARAVLLDHAAHLIKTKGDC